MSKGKFALGAVIGAAAGVVAGMLTAPKSGKETRADIKAKTDELKTQGDKKVAEVKKQGEKMYKDTAKTIDEYRGRAERAVNSAKSELKSEDDFKKK
ncbi:YtxH domain-containing protein [Candidatus Saccharibacteria bacterium]|nr:YtxH domain-containing protein [Candidatus Saccharibacteria bacterium]